MDNVSANVSLEANEIIIRGLRATLDGVLLLIVIVVTVLSLIIIASLISKDNSGLVRSIRVILINILSASIIGGLGSAMYHTASLIIETKTPDSVHGPPACHAIAFLSSTSSSGRVLFTAYYGITVFIVVHYWHQPVLAPENTKYFVIGSAVVWLLALVAGITTVFDGTVMGFCDSINGNVTGGFNFTLVITVTYVVVASIPIIVTPIILIKTACYIKRKTIKEHKDTKKALVKFGLFLLITQGVNAFAQIVVPLLIIGLGVSSQNDVTPAIILGTTLSNLSRIPTNVFIILFFKPVQMKVKRLLCCCYYRHKHPATNRSMANINAATHA